MILECLLYINYHQYLLNISNSQEINMSEKNLNDGSEEATKEVMARIKNKRHYL